MTKFAWRVSRWQPTGAWRVLCLWSVGYDEFRKRPKNWATAAPWVKSDQKWHFCWNLHELHGVRSSFFFNTSSQTILDVKIVKILTLRGDHERQIYYLTRAFFNVFQRNSPDEFSAADLPDVKIVKILLLRDDRERQIYYPTRAFFNVFWRKIDRNPYLTRRFRGPKLLPYTRVFHCRALAAERCTKQR